MSDQTKIEWADSTFNPWIGCTKVSPACDHCYAADLMDTRYGRVQWGAGNPRSRTSEANWREPVRWDANSESFWECGECGWRGQQELDWVDCPACEAELGLLPARRRVFCASLADVFDNEVDPQWRVDLLQLIANTPNLDWLLLTKRIGNAQSMLDDALGVLSHGLTRWADAPWPNVWIGATVVSQGEANRDIPKLIITPTAVRFISVEPMLRPLDIRWALPDIKTACCHRCGFRTNRVGGTCPNDGETLRGDIGVDWVICGGESGPNARPMHPDWARSLRDQCAAAGVPFLFKQWGEWASVSEVEGRGDHFKFPDGATVRRVGKEAAGRTLDGRTHTEFPAVQP